MKIKSIALSAVVAAIGAVASFGISESAIAVPIDMWDCPEPIKQISDNGDQYCGSFTERSLYLEDAQGTFTGVMLATWDEAGNGFGISYLRMPNGDKPSYMTIFEYTATGHVIRFWQTAPDRYVLSESDPRWQILTDNERMAFESLRLSMTADASWE
jgi:hypothetical protein